MVASLNDLKDMFAKVCQGSIWCMGLVGSSIEGIALNEVERRGQIGSLAHLSKKINFKGPRTKEHTSFAEVMVFWVLWGQRYIASFVYHIPHGGHCLHRSRLTRRHMQTKNRSGHQKKLYAQSTTPFDHVALRGLPDFDRLRQKYESEPRLL